MIMSFRFRNLLTPGERLGAGVTAEEILQSLRARLEVEPSLEALIIWTASEVWRDLSEDDWAISNPLESDQNDSDEDLPQAWLLGILNDKQAIS
jgi:hypothetical protein